MSLVVACLCVFKKKTCVRSIDRSDLSPGSYGSKHAEWKEKELLYIRAGESERRLLLKLITYEQQQLAKLPPPSAQSAPAAPAAESAVPASVTSVAPPVETLAKTEPALIASFLKSIGDMNPKNAAWYGRPLCARFSS